jgi:RNA polymerase sigma factor (sigma-70 family)
MTVSRSSDKVLRQVHRLLDLGKVGGLADAQLLDWFVSQPGEAAEAAFEELMIRHGPMVFRVCRSVLCDTDDAEDAFQATFLVMVHRAGSIRRHGSIASWLFGVAHRVACRAKNDAARRRAHESRVAMQTPEDYLPAEECHDVAIVHQEINRLPEALRAPMALCYLEGLTYEVAAQQLGLSEGTVRGRLVRARERLRRRLVARGVTVPAGLLIAGTTGQLQASIPLSLAHSTARIGLGFMAGKSARLLARGVLNSMRLNQIKIAAVLVLLGLSGRYWAWNAVAGLIDDQDKAGAAPVVSKPPDPASASASQSHTLPPAALYRLNGTVRVDGTGEPVAAARLQIHTGDIFEFPSPNQRMVETGADGNFTLDLPAGRVDVQLAEPPIGYYWVPNAPGSSESLSLGPDEPVINREYRLRKGVNWTFELTRGAERRPCPGFISGDSHGLRESFQAQADETGQMHVALPGDGREVTFYVRESRWTSSQLETGHLFLRLDWESNFRPDELQRITPLEGKVGGFRLVDTGEKSATLVAAAQIKPVNDNGRLVIRTALPDRDSKDFGAVTGQVLDSKDRPIVGVSVGIAATRYRVSDELRHQAMTDAQGRYRLRDIPRRKIDGEAFEFQIVVVREGYAGVVSPRLTLKAGATEKYQVIDPIRLEPGVSIHGIVVDHRGRPVVGASVRTSKPVPHSGLSPKIPTVRTDENGRFTMQDLQPGLARLNASDGIVYWISRYAMVGSSRPVLLQLPEERPEPDAARKALAARFEPLRVGQTAVEWQVGPWSDGRAHELADHRGKVIVLYFWGTDFWQSVSALPALGKLAVLFEPRGVVFRAIHRPDQDEQRHGDEVSKLIAVKQAPLIFAFDKVRIDRHSRGMTAQQYGVANYPVVILIDQAGKITFRSDMAAGDRSVAGVFMKTLTDPQTMTEEKANRLVERAIAEEIEAVLEQKD